MSKHKTQSSNPSTAQKTKKRNQNNQVWWLTPVIPTTTTQEAKIGGSWFKASPGKNLVRAYLDQ
jgi:hypothetical protein